MRKIKKFLKNISLFILTDWITFLSLVSFMLLLTYIKVGEDSQVWNAFYWLFDSIWKFGVSIYIHNYIYNKGLKNIFKAIIIYFGYTVIYHIFSFFSSDYFEEILYNGQINQFIYMGLLFLVFIFSIFGANIFIKKYKK